jgi:hypothetical protein
MSAASPQKLMNPSAAGAAVREAAAEMEKNHGTP